MPYTLKWKSDNTYLAAVVRGDDGLDLWKWTSDRKMRIRFWLKKEAQRMRRVHAQVGRIAIVRVK